MGPAAPGGDREPGIGNRVPGNARPVEQHSQQVGPAAQVDADHRSDRSIHAPNSSHPLDPGPGAEVGAQSIDRLGDLGVIEHLDLRR